MSSSFRPKSLIPRVRIVERILIVSHPKRIIAMF